MSEDLTKIIPQNTDEKLTLILTTVQATAVRVDKLEQLSYEQWPILQKVVADIAQLKESVGRLEESVGRLEDSVGRLEDSVGRLEVRVGRLEDSLGRLEVRVGRLEEGQLRLEEGHRRLEEGHRRLEEGQESLRSELLALRRSVDYRFMILSGKVLDTCRSLDLRVTHLESKFNPPNSQT